MPKQVRNRDAGKTAPGERTKPTEFRAELRAENMSAKSRKQHAHNAPVRRAASKVEESRAIYLFADDPGEGLD